MNAIFLHSMGREFMISLALHICVLGAVVVFGHTLEKHREAVVVYLTDEAPGGGQGGSTRAAGPPREGAERSRRRSPRSKPAKSLSTGKAAMKNAEQDIREEQQMSSADRDLSEALASGLRQTGGGEGGQGTGFGTASSPGAGGGVGSGYGRGFGNGRGAADSSLKLQYLKEHFAYIRDLITKNLSYPHMARKMGWRGRVVVAFIIRENGTVENTHVIKSSGYEVLDSNTLKTIAEVQPFPKPPVKAELVIPIVYKLE
ncbi:MAG TPA: hypothetical protein DDZ40_04995 [Deltaproteobacteria bacterium]|nr:hypothetical protein [Deltaproteobacteria bacterium]